MKVSELEDDVFDRQISLALAAGARDVRPPEQVWQRIVDCIVNAERASNCTGRVGNRSLDMVVLSQS